eukprot:15433044-Alexandrium_andersonii.AAC.1
MLWSFEQMWAGTWPDRNHKGEPWQAASQRAARSGTPLAAGRRALVVECLGDQKWLKEAYHLKHHYGAKELCSECYATKYHGPYFF